MCLSDGSRDSKLQEAQTPASVGLQESAGTEGHGAGAVAAQPRDRPSDSARCSASFQRTPATSSGRRLTTNWPSPSSTFLGLAVPTLPPRSLRTTPSLCSPSQRPRAAHVRLSHGGLSNHVSECARPHVCRVCPSCKGRIVLISSAELHLRGMGSTQCREEEGPRAWSNHPGTQLPRQEGVEGLVSGPCQRQGATGPFHRVFLYYYTNRPPPPNCSRVHMTRSGHHRSSRRVSGRQALEGTDPGSPAGPSSHPKILLVCGHRSRQNFTCGRTTLSTFCVPFLHAPFRPLGSSSSTR